MNKIFLFLLIINLVYNQTISIADHQYQIDSLLQTSQLNDINKKYTSILGRNNDPKVLTDVSKFELFFRKLGWTITTIPSLRILTGILYPESTISHFDVKNAVAFTVDDGFCGVENNQGCMLKEVRQLFKTYDAHATFFIVGSHCKNVSLHDVNLLIDDGHEIANHNMMDWSYQNYTTDDFEFDLLLTKKILSYYKQEYSYWYRAPFGQLSATIEKVINKHRMIHVLPDAFAHDTYIPDPNWISKHILRKVKPGSVILIHMPEKGVREWNYKAIELTLKGLKEKNLQILNLTEIKQLEKQ